MKSNCLFEAIKAKIKYRDSIKLIFIPPWKNEVPCPHFMWYDKLDANVYDFHSSTPINHWWQEIWFEGEIRCRPLEVYLRWKATGRW